MLHDFMYSLVVVTCHYTTGTIFLGGEVIE